jgi:hypothetical protein
LNAAIVDQSPRKYTTYRRWPLIAANTRRKFQLLDRAAEHANCCRSDINLALGIQYDCLVGIRFLDDEPHRHVFRILA